MFGGKSNKPSPIDSLIGAGTTITGDVQFTGGLRVDGSRNRLAAVEPRLDAVPQRSLVVRGDAVYQWRVPVR